MGNVNNKDRTGNITENKYISTNCEQFNNSTNGAIT